MEILPGGYLLDSENEDLELIYLIHDIWMGFELLSDRSPKTWPEIWY